MHGDGYQRQRLVLQLVTSKPKTKRFGVELVLLAAGLASARCRAMPGHAQLRMHAGR